MQQIKQLAKKYEGIIKYGFYGVITVLINLILYKIFLMMKMNYVAASLLSYIIASIISYYFNLLFVFNQKILKIKNEIVRILKYFSVRIVSIVSDTILLILLVEIFKFDEFYSKIVISFVIILITYFFNKKIIGGRKR